MREIQVKNDNVVQALRVLKKKLKQDGMLDELKRREQFTPRSKARRDKSVRARINERRDAADQRKRERYRR